MKTINFFLATAILALFTSAGSAQTDHCLFLITNVKMTNVDRIALQPEGNITVGHWDNDYAKVEITISAPNVQRSQLKRLLTLGLFSIKTNMYGQVAELTMPGLDKQTVINGKEFNPILSFHLTLPKSASVEQNPTSIELIAQAQ